MAKQKKTGQRKNETQSSATMNITYKDIQDIHAYRGNPRRNDPAVDAVAASIAEFGFKVPIIIDANDEIVCGHTRLKAARKLGLKEVPVIVADDLSPEQVKAFRLVDNKAAELAEWDIKKLDKELQAIVDIDMSEFGFDVESINEDWETRHEQNKEAERFSDANILQLERAQFPGVGQYDIPELFPETEIPDIEEWIPFNYMLSDTKPPENRGVHFFINDYQFERIWNNPDKYMEKLSRYAAVTTPDFSPYGDMPLAAQIWNHYRKHWVGAYMQMNGVTVIPTIRASTDPRSKDFYLDGEPKGGAVVISSMWTNTEEETETFEDEYTEMIEILHPNKIFVYGKHAFEWMGSDIIRIPTFSENRWG